MARIRKINVSQVEGNNESVLPAGTIAVYEGNDEYALRVHDGVTAGGVPLNVSALGNLIMLANTTIANGMSQFLDLSTPVRLSNGLGNIELSTIDQDTSTVHTWTFGNTTGTLTAPGDIVAGGPNGGHFVIDGTDGDNTSVRWYNMPVNEDHSIIRTFTGNLDQGTELNRGRIQLVWQDSDRSGLQITSYNRTDANNTVEHDWVFQGDGDLVLPAGGDILDSNGNSVLGGATGNQNVWVQTFASDAPATDQVQIATSVEYDADGNIFALFSHSVPGMDNETYTSVAKLSPTGTIIWQVRFSANLNTDGWGLAYDGEDTVYVAGSTAGTPLTYDFATLTKIDAISGTIVWNKTYDFEADSQSAVVDVDSDSNPIMVGHASNGTDNYIITTKVDQALGTVIWSKTLDGQGDDEAYGMAVGPTGEVVTIGYTDTFGVQNAADNLYADLEGNPNWTAGGSINFDGVTADFTFAAGIPTFTNIVDTVGGREVDDVLGTVLGSTIGGADGTDDMVVKVETTAANDTVNRMVVVKYAANGTIAWQKAVQFDANEDCRGTDADIDADGNIYVCGNYDTEIGVAMSLVKFNSSGVEQWSRRIVGDCVDFATSVVVGPDNNLYLSGVTTTPGAESVRWVVAKYSTTGSVVWQRLIENTASWTFTGSLFFENAGGSNIAVGPDYVALAGGFGAFIIDEDPTATVVQIDTNGTLFSVGDWALTAASFTGNLDDTASDITVINAGKTAGTATPTVANFVVEDDDSNFLIGTLYNAPGSDNSLVNGEYSVNLSNTGTVTLPAGGTISEGVVTSNPTIQLTPASPDVASQKLVIKGGGGQYYITENGIDLGTNNNVWAVSDSATFYVYAPTRPDETLYWWIVPEGSGISTTMSGTVELGSEGGGVFNFTVISDAYEFRVRVSPEQDNYDPNSVGVESVLINGDAPAYGDYHLHLTTGDLTETSIFLGTDDHNVRTTTDGKIQITTPGMTNNVWEFDTDGDLTIPGNILSENDINIEVSLSDSTLRRWTFGEDGALTLPTGGHIGPSGGKGAGTTYGGANDHLVSLNSYYNSGLYSSCVTAYADGTLNITAYNDGGPNPAKIWTFANDGTLTLPDNSGIKSSTNIDITIDTPDSSTFNWRFGADGDLTLPAGGDIVNSTGVSQTAQRVEGSWTVTTGTNTYSFTVPMNGTYTLWVKGNIPNGIIIWNATLSISNSNVPAIGTQYAWNYTGGGSPILLTAIPDQIRGTAGGISTDATYAGSTSNRFDFTIANTSGASQTVYYGYTKI